MEPACGNRIWCQNRAPELLYGLQTVAGRLQPVAGDLLPIACRMYLVACSLQPVDKMSNVLDLSEITPVTNSETYVFRVYMYIYTSYSLPRNIGYLFIFAARMWLNGVPWEVLVV